MVNFFFIFSKFFIIAFFTLLHYYTVQSTLNIYCIVAGFFKVYGYVVLYSTYSIIIRT